MNVLIITAHPTSHNLTTGVYFATKKIWKQTIVEFCGMTFGGYHLFGGIDTSEKKVDAVFAAVKKIAKGK